MASGVGRPSKFDDPTALNLTVEKKVKQGLKKIAQRENKSLNDLVLEIAGPPLEQYVKNHYVGNAQHTLDRSVEDSGFTALPTMGEILKPERLDGLPDKDLDDLAKAATARGQEIQAAINRRSKDHRTHFPAVRWPDE